MRDPAAPSGELAGHTVADRYEIRSMIGAGGMGEVYVAYDRLLDRDVALKRLHRRPGETRENLHALLAEARAASSLRHPNIIVIHNVFESGEEAFIDQELAEGKPLDALLGAPFPLERFLALAGQCAGALAVAEQHGVVHCDLKPANIMVSESGLTRIVDFGIARRRRASPEASTLPGPSGLAVTPAYAAPEVLLGEEPTTASDIYSLGIVFHELLTGAHPFADADEVATMRRILHSRPPVPSLSNPEVPASLDRLVMRMLSKSPRRRFRSARDLAEALGAVGRELASGRPASRATRRRSPRAAGKPIRLAVRGFESRTRDARAVALGVGLAESVQARLAEMPGVALLTRSSELPANVVLEGSVERSRRRLRIRFALHDRDRGLTAGGDVIEGEVADIFRLEDLAIQHISGILAREYGLGPLPGTRVLPSRDAAAYELYLRARGLMTPAATEADLAGAIEHLEEALAGDAGFTLAQAALGEASWRRYELSHDAEWARAAESAALRASRENANLPEVRVTLGTVYLGTGRAEAAAREFKQAMALDPRSCEGRRGLARAEEALDHLEEAENAYLAAIEARPEEWIGHIELGVFCFRHGRAEEAQRAFRRVIELSPANVRGYVNLGGVLATMAGREQEAEAALRHALAIRPTYEAYCNLGHILHEGGRFQEAAEMLKRALEMDDRDFRAWATYLAVLLCVPGRKEEADVALRRAAELAERELEVNPQDAYVAALLAAFLAQLGREVDSLRLAEGAILKAPRDAQVLFYATFAFEYLGRRERALEVVSLALEAGCRPEMYQQDPTFESLAADPRFASLVLREGSKA